MARNGVEWRSEEFERNIAALPAAIDGGLRIATERAATDIESYMKMNAPWTDRTSNARNGLRAEAKHDLLKHDIVAYHSVHYGIYLELMQSGKFAIIQPTLEMWAPRTMTTISAAILRLASRGA